MKIPLSLRARNDKWIWQYTNSGIFLVKSAYVLAKKQMNCRRNKGLFQGDSSDTNRDQKILRSIWNVQVHPKIKNFIWRCASNAISVNSNLAKRRILVEIICPLCKGCDEIVVHLMFLCPFARVVWLLS